MPKQDRQPGLSKFSPRSVGEVYKAYNRQLASLVAIKKMEVGDTEDPEFLQRFYCEPTASRQHPNIVTVNDLGEQDGSPYLVMQNLEGESLRIDSRFRPPPRRRGTDPLHPCTMFIICSCRLADTIKND